MPRKRARRSFSRIASKVRPKGARSSAAIADGDGEEHQDEIVEGLVIAQDVDLGEAEIQRLAAPATQPVIAPGDVVPAEGDEVEDLAEGDGDHGEIDAAQPHDEGADDGGGQGAGEHADEDAE